MRRDKYDVYIGRPSYWGNPFSEKVYGREQCIEMFREKFMADPEMQKRAVAELSGKTLGCYCKPKACHGDVLAAFVNSANGVAEG